MLDLAPLLHWVDDDQCIGTTPMNLEIDSPMVRRDEYSPLASEERRPLQKGLLADGDPRSATPIKSAAMLLDHDRLIHLSVIGRRRSRMRQA